MPTTALVTGSEGFIGSHMLQFLLAKNWKVIGTHLNEPTNSKPTQRNLTQVQCDLRNGQRISQLLNEFEPNYIFHFGAQSLPTVSWSNPVMTFESNIMGSLYLFEAARYMQHRPKIVSACSSAEYGNMPESAIPVTEKFPLNPVHPYGISKLCLDLLAREYFVDHKVPAVNIRLFNTTGPGKTLDAPSDFVRQLVAIKKGQQQPVVETGNLKARRSFLDVRDAVRGFYLAAKKGKPGEAYHLCASPLAEIGELLRKAISIAGIKPEIRPVKRLMRPNDERIIYGSTQKIRKHTGWTQQYSIEQTLISMFEYWEQRI
jgi:GDP-4-dehydro-6-deoxy-D-mannose reductase